MGIEKGCGMGDILIGISSWTDPELAKDNRFYPAAARSAEAKLRFYASQFELVEADSTYYYLARPGVSAVWASRTPDGFLFDVKAFRLFTGHPTPLSSLPADISAALPARPAGKGPGRTISGRNVYYHHLPPDLVEELWSRFERGLSPLAAAGKLGLVVFQFPPWFLPGDEQRRHLRNCRERLLRYRLGVEFRQSSWVNDRNRERTLGFLRENDLAFICVDEPQGFKSSLPPVAEATAAVSMVRFHGRNRETWERRGITTTERFDWAYSEDELREWLPGIGELASRTKQCHVVFNTHGAKAVTSARLMTGLLGKVAAAA